MGEREKAEKETKMRHVENYLEKRILWKYLVIQPY